MKAYKKDFDSWFKIKTEIDKQENKQYIREGEIRWASIGVNVGSEIDGKGVSFTRPVLVLAVVGSYLALVIPLSSQNKDHPGYISFDYKDKIDYLCVHQIRIISQKRIFSRILKISNLRLKGVKKSVKDFFWL